MKTLAQPKVARVLFDESHSEAWTIRRELAEQMQPAHPEDSSYAIAAGKLADRDFDVIPNADRPLTRETLAGADVVVIAHPSDPKWEATTNSGRPTLRDDELDALDEFVRGGGGLIVLAETEQDKYGNNLNLLLSRFGIEVENATVQDYEHNHSAPSWVLADLADGFANGNGSNGASDASAEGPHSVDLLARVHEACFYRSGTLALHNGGHVLARTFSTASRPGAPIAAVAQHGTGRVVVLADSDLFGDDCIGELDNEALWLNLVYWAAQPAFGGLQTVTDSPAAADRHWAALKEAVEELRATQEPDGSVDLSKHDGSRLAELVEDTCTAVGGLARHFPHQREYVEALRADLRHWANSGFTKPDFVRSIEAFHPEADRRDGIEHLVVFPMYKQNASTDTCFEALIVRVPWPEFVADLEASGYDNPKFVPVNFVDYTSGYDSECAVLFPETFSTAERPPSYFGGIFCDREAERFRRVCGGAADLLDLNLPPDAACLLTSPELSMDAYIVWDLIHDRTHMHGDLPFDPFMIRQRSPYWMYSLEELRCDLTAFGEAVKLEKRGLRVRALRAVRDPLRPPLPLPGHRIAQAQLRRPRRPAPVRIPAQGGLPPLDRQPPDDRLGACCRRRRRPAREGSGPLPLRHRPLQARPVDRRPRPRGHLRCAGGRLGLGEGQPRPAGGAGAEGARRPGQGGRVPAQPLLRPAPEEARAGAGPAGRRDLSPSPR